MESCKANRLASTVKDLMQCDVQSISSNASLVEAARKVAENQIGCLPVVNEYGHCVGIVSGRDIARWIAYERGRESDKDLRVGRSDPQGVLEIEEWPDDRVARYMSTGVQTISAESLVDTAARRMVAAKMHHLVVLDGTSRPVGVLSALDLLTEMVARREIDSEPR